MIEHAGEGTPIIGLIGQHPKQFHNEKPDFRHIIPSRAFSAQFDIPPVDQIKAKIGSYCWKNRGPLGSAEVTIEDREGRSGVMIPRLSN